MLGHILLAFHGLPFFFSGLGCVILGTGLLKPNISAIVGQLYDQKDTRRDAGFSIFYMGINLGAFMGPLIAGYLAQRVDWHIGFASAGIGIARGGKSLATTIGFPEARGVVELTVLAPDHPWLLSIIAGACSMAGANIVDAQIFTTTDGRALDTIALSREFDQDADEARRANRIAASIEKALRGEIKLPEVVAQRAAAKGRLKAFALEPTVTINNQWSNRYTMVEVTGLDRPGLLFELTATLSKLNLNIGSAHVATFGERVVDVFYVTDLFGAKITSATRQAAIKRALISLFTVNEPAKRAIAKPARSAAAS